MASIEKQVEDFLAHCSQNESLREKLKASMNDEQIADVAKLSGFNLTSDNLRSVFNVETDDEELTSDDLELVAGGAKRGGGVLNSVSGGLVCNTIRSLFSTESGCGGVMSKEMPKLGINRR